MTPLARWMADTKTTPTALHQQTGLSLSSIVKYRDGDRNPKYEAREIIARVTNGVVGLANWPKKRKTKARAGVGRAA